MHLALTIWEIFAFSRKSSASQRLLRFSIFALMTNDVKRLTLSHWDTCTSRVSTQIVWFTTIFIDFHWDETLSFPLYGLCVCVSQRYWIYFVNNVDSIRSSTSATHFWFHFSGICLSWPRASRAKQKQMRRHRRWPRDHGGSGCVESISEKLRAENKFVDTKIDLVVCVCVSVYLPDCCAVCWGMLEVNETSYSARTHTHKFSSRNLLPQ